MYRDRSGHFHKKPDSIIPKKRESAYGVFIQNDKIILVKPAWINLWEVPGGGKEKSETIQEAMVREFKEETGYIIQEFQKEPFHVIKTKFYAVDLKEYFDSIMYFFKIERLGTQNKY